MKKWVKLEDQPLHITPSELMAIQDRIRSTPIFRNSDTTLGEYIEQSGNRGIWPLVNNLITAASNKLERQRHDKLRDLFDNLSEAMDSQWNARAVVDVIDKEVARAVKDVRTGQKPSYELRDDSRGR